MAVCSQLSICCLLLSVAYTQQRMCRTATAGSAAVCEATLGSNWTLVCSYDHQRNTTGVVVWKVAGRSFTTHNALLTLTNLSYNDVGVYSCSVAIINGGVEVTGSLRLLVKEGRAPQLLNSNDLQQGVGEGCQGTQVARGGLIQAIVTGYPQPTIMWYRDVQRTSRITNDSIYQLLPNGDLMVRDLVQGMKEIGQGYDVLYVTAVNEFGIKRYCVQIHWSECSVIQYYPVIIVKPTESKNLVVSNLKYHYDHSTCFCKASCPAHNFQYFILPGLCLGYVLSVFVIVWVVMLYCQPYYRQHCIPVDTESGKETVTLPLAKTDSDDFVYVVHSPQSEHWVEDTLMYKLRQWQLKYTTYELSAIPGQPKIVEKLRLCSEANKIIIVLANDSLTEHAFVNEVLHVISSEQMKVIPVLYGVSELELQSNLIYRSVMVYVSIHHTDANFDIRLKQALS